MALFVDQPGGPLDQVAADADVATFLNDRFVPVFLVPRAARGLLAGTTTLVDAEGCVVATLAADTPEAWIAAANQVALDAASGASQRQPLPPVRWGLTLPDDSRLRRGCAADPPPAAPGTDP